MSNLNKHIKSDKIKWIVVAVVLLLIIGTIIAMCLQIFGKDKAKPSEWFKKDETEQTVTDEDKSSSDDEEKSVQPAALLVGGKAI